ncbi:hypothetical protein ACIA5G_52095 [Amycolatopsis sp. NPDC051758]|uniref:hypothetical protein n=1 Tax=Amycolatopsis sp. NPDC051758 TaxID=3363935 RepID=UPI0037986512
MLARRWLVLATLVGVAACAVLLLVPVSTAGPQPGTTLACGNAAVRSTELERLANPGRNTSTASTVWMSSASYDALQRCERLRDYTRFGALAVALLTAGAGWMVFRRRRASLGEK